MCYACNQFARCHLTTSNEVKVSQGEEQCLQRLIMCLADIVCQRQMKKKYIQKNAYMKSYTLQNSRFATYYRWVIKVCAIYYADARIDLMTAAYEPDTLPTELPLYRHHGVPRKINNTAIIIKSKLKSIGQKLIQLSSVKSGMKI